MGLTDSIFYTLFILWFLFVVAGLWSAALVASAAFVVLCEWIWIKNS